MTTDAPAESRHDDARTAEEKIELLRELEVHRDGSTRTVDPDAVDGRHGARVEL